MAFYTTLVDTSCSVEFVEDTELLPYMETIVVNKNFSRYPEFYEVSMKIFPMIEAMLGRYLGKHDVMCASALSDTIIGPKPKFNMLSFESPAYLLAGGLTVGFCIFLAEKLWFFRIKK